MSHFSGSMDLDCGSQLIQVPLCTNRNTNMMRSKIKSKITRDDSESFNQQNCRRSTSLNHSKGQINLLYYLIVFVTLCSLGLLCLADHLPIGINQDCGLNEFKCKSGQCVQIDRLHNGFKDCIDGSDEDCLDNQHKCLCGLPVCLDKSRVNDGKKDCIDGSDEGHADTNLCRHDTSELAVGRTDEMDINNKSATPRLVAIAFSKVNDSSSSSLMVVPTTGKILSSSSSFTLASSPSIIAEATEDIFVEVTGTFVPYEQLRPFRPAVASSVIALPQYSSIVPTGSGSVIEITGTLLSGNKQEPSTITVPTSAKLVARTSILFASTAPAKEKSEDTKITTESPLQVISRNIEKTRFLVTASRAPVSKSSNKVKLYTGFVSINGTKYNLLTVSNGTGEAEVSITINEFDESYGRLEGANRRIKPGEVGVNLNQYGLTINLPSTLNKMISSRDLLLGNADAHNNLKYSTIMISDSNKVKFDQTKGSNGLLVAQEKSRRLDTTDGLDVNKDELADLLKLSVSVENSPDNQPKNIVVKQAVGETYDAELKQPSNKIKAPSHQIPVNRKFSESKERFVAYGGENSDPRSVNGKHSYSLDKIGYESTASPVTSSYAHLPTRTVSDNELVIDYENPVSSKYQITPPLESATLASKSVPVYERPSSRLQGDLISRQIKPSGLIGTTTIFGFIDFTTTINGSLVIFTPNTKQLAAVNDKRKWKSTSSGLVQPTSALSMATSTPLPLSSSLAPSSINIRDNLKLRSRLGTKLRHKIEQTATQNSITESSEWISKSKFGKYESINFNPVSSREIKSIFKQSSVQSGPLPSVTYHLVNRQSASSSLKPTSVLPTGLLSSFTGTVTSNHSLTEWTTLVIGTYIKGTYAHILESKSRIYPEPELTAAPSSYIPSIQPTSKPLLLTTSTSSSSSSSSSSLSVSSVLPLSSIEPVPSRISAKPDVIKPSHQITITSGFILPTAASSIEANSTSTSTNFFEKPSTSLSSSFASSAIGLSSSIIEPEIMVSSRKYEPTASLDETVNQSSSSSSSTSALTFTPIRAHVTTYTYYTTYFKDGSMLVSSHKEIVTNTQSAIQSMSTPAPITSTKVNLPVTFYTTYTYYTTLYNGGSPTIKSREEIVSSVSTSISNSKESTHNANIDLITKATIKSIEPTQSLSSQRLQSTLSLPSSLATSSSAPISLSTSSTKLEASVDSVSRRPINPARTYYTTYTYFTTYLRGGSKSIVSRFETVTNVASGENEINKTSTSTISPTLIKPSAALTRYTTYTFYTTYVKSGSNVVSTSKKTITNVATIPKENVRPTGSLKNTIKPSKSARTDLITFTYFTTNYNQGKLTVSSRFETVSSVISEPAFGQRSAPSIKSSLSLTPSSSVNNNLLSPSVTFDQPFATDSPFDKIKSLETSSPFSDISLSSSKTPELPAVLEIKDMTSLDLNSLLAGLKVPITRYTTYTYFTTLGQGVSRSTVTRTQVVSNVVTDTIKLSLPSVTSSSLTLNQNVTLSGLKLNRRAPVLDELEVASSNENQPQHAHDKPVTFYTTTTHYTTILLPTGGSTILSNIDVRASVTRLATDQVLPTRETEPLSDERGFDTVNVPLFETTLSSSISPPSRYDFGTNQVEVISTVNIHRTHGADPLLTYETTLTYLTTYFDGARPSRTETRRETVTEIRRNTLINPSVSRKPLIVRRTRLRGGAARDISLDPRDGSHLTRKPIVVITKKPTFDSTATLDKTFISEKLPQDVNHQLEPHLVHESAISPTPVTYYTTFTHFTTELVGGFPVVRSREQILSTVITDRILPTRSGFGLRPTIGFRAKRSVNDGDDLIMEESNLDPRAFELSSGQILSASSEVNQDTAKSEYSEGSIVAENNDESSSSSSSKEPKTGTYILINTIKSSTFIESSLDSTKITSNTSAFASTNAFLAPTLSSFLLSSPVSVLVTTPSSPEDPTPSLDSIGSNQSSKVGIISSQVSSIVQNGQTTLFTTQIYGTYIGTIYAHLAKTQTSLLPSLTSHLKVESSSSSLPIGLISESVRSEINSGTTTLYKTQVHGTFINGVYAHFGQVSSNVINPSTLAEIKSTQTPISVSVSTEIDNDRTTLHTAEIYQTMISGLNAQFTRTISSIVEPSSIDQQMVLSTTSTRPFIVFPSRKRTLNLQFTNQYNLSNASELNNTPTTTNILIQTVTKTVTATPVVDNFSRSQALEEQERHEKAEQTENSPNKNAITNDDELAEYYENRESGSEKIEVGHDEYDSEADEDVHHEDAVEHPNGRNSRTGRQHRPTREEGRYYDYEAHSQSSFPTRSNDHVSSQNSRYNGANGRNPGYGNQYLARKVQPDPATIPTPVTVLAPQARFKEVFGQRVGASGRSLSSSPSSYERDHDPYTGNESPDPAAPRSQPSLIPHSRGRFAGAEPISNRQESDYPYAQAQSPTTRPVEVLQPFQNVHETLAGRVYHSDGVTTSSSGRPSNRQASQLGRRRSSSSSLSRSNTGDNLGITPRSPVSERSFVSRFQTPKRTKAQQAPSTNGRSIRNRGGNAARPVIPSYVESDIPVARVKTETDEFPVEEEIYIEPSTRGRNHFVVTPRNRGTGKTRRIILNNNPEPSRPPQLIPASPYTLSPSLVVPTALSESPSLPTPNISKTPITITSLVSVIKTLPIRHGFLTSYATITTTAFNRSVINPNEYQLRLNPTNTIETLTIYDSSTIDPTKVRETLITTTTLLEVKLIPIRIGFSTRTDTLTDTQVLTTFTVSDRTIHPTVHHAFPGLHYAPSVAQNDPAVGKGPQYLPPSLPYPLSGVIGGGQLSFSQVTATITGTTTLTSTKVVSLALHGKTLLSTLTLSSTLETTSVTTSLVPVPVSLAPSLPILVTTPPPVVTTSLTIHITGDSGDVTELITVLTIPGQVFHTKAIRSIKSTPVNYNHLISIESTLAPLMT